MSTILDTIADATRARVLELQRETSLDTVKVLLDVLEEMTIGISPIDAK